MRRAIVVIASLLACTVPAQARINVRALPLPAGATIDPFGTRALVAAGHDGTIAATVTLHGWMTRVVVWHANGAYQLLPAIGLTVVAFDEANALIANGAHPMRIDGTSATAIDLSTCEAFPQLSAGMTVAGMLSNGSLIANMLSPAVVNLDDTNGQTAPVVLHLRSWQCLNMGNGIAMATAGLYTAGYTAYIANVPAPSNVISSKERFVAMRWHERTREPLGTGVALAVNADGIAVGADTLAGSTVDYNSTPHALLWPSSGAPVALAPSSLLSVAYAVDSRGRTIGMLEDTQRRHFAFLWENGSLHRLDDLVAAPGWRFECAYAFTPSGALVGIGTDRGTPTVFEINGL